MNVKRVELLAPAGSSESLRGAVNAGADAVYMGGALFSARAYADNPDVREMIENIRYCHFYGKKMYLALNTLLKQDELDNELLPFLEPLYEGGIDGVIVQDIGVMSRIYGYFPDLPIHISTQAAVMMAEGSEWIRSRIPSVTRVVPARELSFNELKRFRRDTDLEIEVFVHGALCVCYSGMCLMSSYAGDRSGNRGRCAQPCRKPYRVDDSKTEYLLSPKDQCLLDDIPALIDIGIDSFKIEGRMKSPEYTAGTVAVYRRAIDEYTGAGPSASGAYLSPDNASGREILKELYNRGGFNQGYLHTYNGPDMMSFDKPNHTGVRVGQVINVSGREAVIMAEKEILRHDVVEIRRGNDRIYEFTAGEDIPAGRKTSCLTMKDRLAEKGDGLYRTRNETLIEKIRKEYLSARPCIKIDIRFTAHIGNECELEVSAGQTVVKVTGLRVEAARNAPSTRESIERSLVRLGDTAFTPGKLLCDCDDGIFIPVGELNRLRREASAGLEEALITLGGSVRTGFKNETRESDNTETQSVARVANMTHDTTIYTVSVWTEEQLDAAVSAGAEEVIFNLSGLEPDRIDKVLEKYGKQTRIILGLPYVCRAEIHDRLHALLSGLNERHPDMICLARNYEEIDMLEKSGIRYRIDHTPYSMNTEALDVLSAGAQNCTMSTELSLKELIPDERSETIIYGYLPSMISAQCVFRNITGRCSRHEDGSVSFTYEGNRFRTRQLCDLCTNIIYNSACLDLTDRIEELKRAGVKKLRIDLTFESQKESFEILNRKLKNSIIHPDPSSAQDPHDKPTRGHFYRPVL